MAEVPVRALVDFARQPDGLNRLHYAKGEVYILPDAIVTHYVKTGKIEIVNVVEETPKPKRKRKSNKETQDVTS